MAHVAIMIRIIPSENRNMYFRMIQDSDTTFKVEMGRVGAAPYVRYYPLSVWDEMYQKKISEGYQDKTTLICSIASENEKCCRLFATGRCRTGADSECYRSRNRSAAHDGNPDAGIAVQ